MGVDVPRAQAEARAAGLTDAEIEAELTAYNAERRSQPVSGCVVATDFYLFRDTTALMEDHTLNFRGAVH